MSNTVQTYPVKAFDSLTWGFLDSVLEQMNFPDKWRRWIHSILSSVKASVLINGSPTAEISCERGLRQGDPLSPFLFIIAMEALSSTVKRACHIGLYRGIRCNNNGPMLSHFLFADDVVFLGAWDETNIRNLGRILLGFYLISGLKINFSKSSLFGIGGDMNELGFFATILRCKQGSFPLKYLGLQVGANMNLVKNWKTVVDIFKSRLSLWKAKTLSYGGRISLIKSVLNALPSYYFSLYRAPVHVINTLDKMRRAFLWGGDSDSKRIHWIPWDKVTASKEYGGLGIGSLLDSNRALLSKWWWRFKVEKKTLWKKIIWAIHHNSHAWCPIPSKLSIPGPWVNICKVTRILEEQELDIGALTKGILGNGKSIMFWLDSWLRDGPLMFRFPALFKLEVSKNCCVADRIKTNNMGTYFQFYWKRALNGSAENGESISLVNLLGSVSITDEVDRWSWGLDQSNMFSVKSVKKKMESQVRSIPEFAFFWNNWIPKKVAFMSWRAYLERLPTLVSLARRNIPVGSLCCPLCADYDETTDHLFTGCSVAQELWNVISNWCRLPTLFFFGLHDIFRATDFLRGSQKWKKIIHAVLCSTVWILWKTRNEKYFNQRPMSIVSMVDEIKALSFGLKTGASYSQ